MSSPMPLAPALELRAEVILGHLFEAPACLQDKCKPLVVLKNDVFADKCGTGRHRHGVVVKQAAQLGIVVVQQLLRLEIEGVVVLIKAGHAIKDILCDAPESLADLVELRPRVLQAEPQAGVHILVEMLKQSLTGFRDPSADLFV